MSLGVWVWVGGYEGESDIDISQLSYQLSVSVSALEKSARIRVFGSELCVHVPVFVNACVCLCCGRESQVSTMSCSTS